MCFEKCLAFIGCVSSKWSSTRLLHPVSLYTEKRKEKHIFNWFCLFCCLIILRYLLYSVLCFSPVPCVLYFPYCLYFLLYFNILFCPYNVCSLFCTNLQHLETPTLSVRFSFPEKPTADINLFQKVYIFCGHTAFNGGL